MAPRSATEEMAALAMETSDTTATEAEAAPQEPQSRSRALKLAGAAGAAALAAGAMAAVMSGRAAPFSVQQAGGGGVTALQQSRNFKVGIGCTNWRMKFQEAQLCSADECWDLCAMTAGCKAMNFQGFDNEFCGVGGGKERGTCYLYGCDCQETDNGCWTLGIMPATGGTGWVAGGTGGATGGIGGATGGIGGATGGTGGATGGAGGAAGGAGGATGSTGGATGGTGGATGGTGGATGGTGGVASGTGGAAAGIGEASATTSMGFPAAPSSTTLAKTVTGKLVFSSGGTKAEVETAVGETLVDVLGLQPSQVTVEAMGARRLSFGPQVMGPRRLFFLPWIVSFAIQVVDAVATAAAELVDKVEAIVKDPTALADKLGEKLPDLEPETLAVAVADASGEIPAFTSTAPASKCSDVTSSCLETMCCEDENKFCYKKNDYWAGCRPDCNIGIHVHDPPEHQTEWTCEVLDPSPDAPLPINEAAPPTNCAGQYVDCSAAKCCDEAGEWCYKKNEYWSQCLPKCITGISPHDKFPHNTPWSCEPNDLDTENIPPAIPGAMPITTAAPDSGTETN